MVTVYCQLFCNSGERFKHKQEISLQILKSFSASWLPYLLQWDTEKIEQKENETFCTPAIIIV